MRGEGPPGSVPGQEIGSELKEQPKSISVRDLIAERLKFDLEFKVKGLPDEFQENARDLNESFQDELLDLLNEDALGMQLNETQALYLRNVISNIYHLETLPQGQISSHRDQEKILMVATYINSLRPEGKG